MLDKLRREVKRQHLLTELLENQAQRVRRLETELFPPQVSNLPEPEPPVQRPQFPVPVQLMEQEEYLPPGEEQIGQLLGLPPLPMSRPSSTSSAPH